MRKRKHTFISWRQGWERIIHTDRDMGQKHSSPGHNTTKHIGTSEPGHSNRWAHTVLHMTTFSCKDIHDEMLAREAGNYVHSCAVRIIGCTVHFIHPASFYLTVGTTHHDGHRLSLGLFSSVTLKNTIYGILFNDAKKEQTFSSCAGQLTTCHMCYEHILLEMISHLLVSSWTFRKQEVFGSSLDNIQTAEPKWLHGMCCEHIPWSWELSAPSTWAEVAVITLCMTGSHQVCICHPKRGLEPVWFTFLIGGLMNAHKIDIRFDSCWKQQWVIDDKPKWDKARKHSRA